MSEIEYHGYGWRYRSQKAESYQVPDRIGEVLAWRCWRWAATGHITSVHMDSYVWMPRAILEASCLKPGYHCHLFPLGVPNTEHSCGFYALKELDYSYLLEEGYLNHAPVWGIVGLSGRIIEGTRGYRAQRARPIHLWVRQNEYYHINTAILSAVYDVPVEEMDLERLHDDDDGDDGDGDYGDYLPGAAETFDKLRRKGVFINGDRRDDQGVHDRADA